MSNKPSQIAYELLKKRGINTQEEIDEFFSKKPKLSFDPFLIPNMKKAVPFILSALSQGKKICIYGDYDVDGITATALLFEFFAEFISKKKLSFYIPSRFSEGYGLNENALRKIKDQGAEIIVTVDLGITGKTEIEFAKNLGMKFLVTDHHEVDMKNTPDCIILNPKLINENSELKYPFKDISGCAVAFKFIQAIQREVSKNGFLSSSEEFNIDINDKNKLNNLKIKLNSFIDLVAISTVCDVMPLLSENRTFLKYGLKDLRKGKRNTLKKLFEKIDLDSKKIDTKKIGYSIGPYFNAPGRLKSAETGLNFLIENDSEKIDRLAEDLVEKNKYRQDVQKEAFEKSITFLEKNYKGEKLIFLRPENLHEGIAGIVAGKIRERFNRPTFVFADDENGWLKASCRSIESINLIELLRKFSELFLKLGGHKMAAGFSIKNENYDILFAKLENEIKNLEKENPALFKIEDNFDFEILPKDISISLAKELAEFAPFGVANEEPILKIKDLVIENFSLMGKNNEHLKIVLDEIELVAFYSAEKFAPLLAEKKPVTIYGNLSINRWQNNETVQVIIRKMTF